MHYSSESSTKGLRRFVSGVLALVFMAQHTMGLAEATPPPGAPFAQVIRGLGLSRSVALIEGAYQAPGEASKTVFLIRDAHTNPSAQMNLSLALDSILAKENIRTVFLEGGSGDDSLSFLRRKASLDRRRKVGLSYLRLGELSGAEFLDLVSERTFSLIGVEDRSLYDESLAVYRILAAEREKHLASLDRFEAAVRTLKPRVFNDRLLTFDGKREAGLAGNLALTDYADALVAEADRLGIELESYPHLRGLGRLREMEKGIDFQKADDEQLRAVQAESEALRQAAAAAFQGDRSPFKATDAARPEAKAFYALLEEAVEGKDAYPELLKYLRYLKEAEQLDFPRLLEERTRLEEAVYVLLARSGREVTLRRIAERVRVFRRLLELTALPSDFAEYRRERALDVVEMTAFLNRELLALEGGGERALFLPEDMENALERAEKFYFLTLSRDRAFVRKLLEKMERAGETKSVLVAGGYHTPHLRAILEEKGVSYVCVTPRVLRETDRKRYEKLLFGRAAGPSRKASGRFDTLATLPIRETSEFPRFQEALDRATGDFAAATAIPDATETPGGGRLSTARNLLAASLLVFVSSDTPDPNRPRADLPGRPAEAVVAPLEAPPVREEAVIPEAAGPRRVEDAATQEKMRKEASLAAFRAKLGESADLRALESGLPALFRAAREDDVVTEASPLVIARANALVLVDEEAAKKSGVPAQTKEAERKAALERALRYGAREKDLAATTTEEKARALAIRSRAEYEAATPEIQDLIDQANVQRRSLEQLTEKAVKARENADHAWSRAGAAWQLSVRLRDSIRPQKAWPKDFIGQDPPRFETTALKGTPEYVAAEKRYTSQMIAFLRARSAYTLPERGRPGRVGYLSYIPSHAPYLPQYEAFSRKPGGEITYYESAREIPEKVRPFIDLYGDGQKTGYLHYDRESKTLYGSFLDWRIETDKGELVFGVKQLRPTEAPSGILQQNLDVFPGPGYKKGADKETDALLEALRKGKARTVVAVLIDDAEEKRLNAGYDEYYKRIERMNERLIAKGFRTVQIAEPDFKIEKDEKTGRKMAWFRQGFDPQSRANGVTYLAYVDYEKPDFDVRLLNGRSESYRIYRKAQYRTGSQQTLADPNLDYARSAIVESAVFGGPGNARIAYLSNVIDTHRAAEAMERMSIEGGAWVPAPGIEVGKDAAALHPVIPVIGRQYAKDLRAKLSAELLKDLEKTTTPVAALEASRALDLFARTGFLLRPNGERYLVISNPEDVEEDAAATAEALSAARKTYQDLLRRLEKERGELPKGARLSRVPDASDAEAIRAAAADVYASRKREALGARMALQVPSGVADVFAVTENSDSKRSLSVRVEGADVLIEVDREAERRERARPDDAEQRAAREFLAEVKTDRMEAESLITAESPAVPFAVSLPVSLLAKQGDSESFEAGIRLLVAQVLELRGSARYSRTTFFLNPAGLDERQREALEALVRANVAKGHAFLAAGDPTDLADPGFSNSGVVVRFVDSDAAGALERDARTVTIPVGAPGSAYFLWDRIFVIGQAVGAVYSRTGVFDPRANAIDDSKVSASDLTGVLAVYNRNAATPPDVGRFLGLLRSEKNSDIFRSHAFILPPIGRLLENALSIARNALRYVGGSA